MCGITGVINLNWEPLKAVEPTVYKNMVKAMEHRGPDEESELREKTFWLGFSRLSIIDLDHGRQPMTNETGSVICICNGEIYNYKELTADLVRNGHKFKTKCDVEVLVHLYEEYGTALFKKLNGQFAFALYDKAKKLFLLGRDHVGICPLFYTIVDNHLVFASEIKSILKYPGVSRAVNLEGLDQIFCMPGLISPTTMFKEIKALKPGHMLKIQADHFEIEEYWDLDYPLDCPVRQSESYYMEQLHDLMEKSIKYRLHADVPVGLYVSGGLDSAIIAGLSNHSRQNGQLSSFGIVFNEKRFDESHYQHLVRDFNNTKHVEIKFDTDMIAGRLTDMIRCAETPLKETYNTCGLALSSSVKNADMKVVLTGEGADELFGGYVGYKLDRQRQQLYNELSPLEKMFEAETRQLLWGDEDFQYEKNFYPFEEVRRSLYSSSVNDRFSSFNCLNEHLIDQSKFVGRSKFQKRSYLDFKLRLSDHLLADHGDRIGYANSVEARYPFLDIDVIEFAKQIPDDLKLNNHTEKYILRKAFSKYVPAGIQNREKFGFVAPGTKYLLQQDKEFVGDLLSYERIKRQGYFNPDAIESLKNLYQQPDFNLSETFEVDMLMIVLTFSLFVDLFEIPTFS